MGRQKEIFSFDLTIIGTKDQSNPNERLLSMSELFYERSRN